MTTESTMGVNAGQAFIAAGFNSGVLVWGASSTKTVGGIDSLEIHKERIHTDLTVWRRRFGYNVTYTATPVQGGNSGCTFFTPRDNDSGTIYVRSSETRGKLVSCPGCAAGT